ncbi:MAG: hypothetical protein AB7Q17_10775 [Phycisphaerae bacterium]
MNSPSRPVESGAPRRDAGYWLRRAALSLVRRAYALALIALILWVSYLAVRYLVVSLITPGQTPRQIADVPKRLDPALLLERRPDWLGLASVETPRSPLARYHRYDNWLQADRFNGCTQSGCHAPLPHAKRKEDRAFLNLHATSIHCGVCHLQNAESPLPLVWYDLERGEVREPPALLQLFDWLSRHGPELAAEKFGAPEQQRVGELLKQAGDEGAAPSLARLAQHVRAVRPGSGALRQLIASAREIVPRDLRGAYGAKLALRAPGANRPLLKHPGTDDAVRRYLQEAPTATPERKQELLAAVHPLRREKPLMCSACHTPEQTTIAHTDLGYPPARIRALHAPAVFQMIEHIARGEPFYLPAVSRPGEPAATTRPADGSAP